MCAVASPVGIRVQPQLASRFGRASPRKNVSGKVQGVLIEGRSSGPPARLRPAGKQDGLSCARSTRNRGSRYARTMSVTTRTTRTNYVEATGIPMRRPGSQWNTPPRHA